MAIGKFAIKETKTGVKFNLKASNGEIILSSQVYKSDKSCLNGIQSVIKNAPIAAVEIQTEENYKVEKCPKFEVYEDNAGETRFRLKARNGEPILASEGYKAKDSCKNGIASVVKNAPEAEVIQPEE